MTHGLARVSVLIPVYKGEAFIARAIESALSQTHPDVEIIVVNDGSPDNSSRVLAPYLLRPNVRYIEKVNGGVASARNAGLAIATGQYVALLDQDDAWYPDKLARQVAVLNARPDVALVHGDVTYIGADNEVLPHDPHFPAKVEGRCFNQLFMANPVMACTAIFRRCVVDEVGRFDDGIAFSDDYDLWLRIARHHAIAYIDEPLALYRIHGSNESRKIAGIVAATLQTLHKALRTTPDCRALVGDANIGLRFAHLECVLSRFHFSNRRWLLFAWHLARAAKHDGATAIALGLPADALDRLRWYSKKLGLR